MAEFDSSLLRQLRDLAAQSARLQAHLMRQYVDAAASVARGNAPGPLELLSSAGAEAQRYLREATRINVDYARALQELVAGSGDRLRSGAQPVGQTVGQTVSSRQTAGRPEAAMAPQRSGKSPAATAAKTARKTAPKTAPKQARKTAPKQARKTAPKPARKTAAKRPARAPITPVSSG